MARLLRRHYRVLALASLVLIEAGCATEYVYTRQVPAVGRHSPTVFTVRLSVNKEAGSIVMLTKTHDREGEIDSSIDTETGCKILDERNWECEGIEVPTRGVVDQVLMRDGTLYHKYWGDNRVFRTRRVFRGF